MKRGELLFGINACTDWGMLLSRRLPIAPLVQVDARSVLKYLNQRGNQ